MELTIGRRSWLVSSEMLWRARRWVETWRALWATSKLWGHAMGRVGVLRRGSQPRSALVGAARHYTTKEVAWPVANLGRLRLRWAVVVGALAGAAALLKFALELGDSVFVSG